MPAQCPDTLRSVESRRVFETNHGLAGVVGPASSCGPIYSSSKRGPRSPKERYRVSPSVGEPIRTRFAPYTQVSKPQLT